MNKNRVELPIGKVVLTTVFIFLVIYNISFKFAPSFTSARVSILLLSVYFIVIGLKWPFHIGRHALLILAFLLPVLIQYLFSGDSTQTSRIVQLFLYSFVGASLIAALAGNLKVALFSYTTAVATQAVIIIVALSNVELRGLIDAFISQSSNYTIEYLYRAPGFTSTGGSDLSVIQATGVISGIWLLYITKSNRNFLQTLFKYFLITICGVSAMFVGRTGMLISVVSFIGYLFASYSTFKARNILYICLVIFAGYMLTNVVTNYVSNIDKFSSEYFYNWAFGSYFGSGTSSEEFTNQAIPNLSIETIFGTGMVVEPGGYGNASGNDSGYIQSYYSMGLIFSVFFYCFLAYALALYVRGRGVVGWFLFVIIFVIEIKEPFIFKYVVVFLLMLTYYATTIEKMNSLMNGTIARRDVSLR